MFLTEKYVGALPEGRLTFRFFVVGLGNLPGFLHPVNSRMLCLPQTKMGTTGFSRTKSSLV